MKSVKGERSPAPLTHLTWHSPDMIDRWRERRSEAISHVSEALREDAFEEVRAERLARTVHRLAGAAGMFGEEELGRRAAALERALRVSRDRELQKRLACELIALA